MRRRDGVAPKKQCRLRSTVRTAPPQDKCNQVIGWEFSDPAERMITSDMSNSLSDCDAFIEPPQLSGQELPSRGSNRQLELRAWKVIQREIDDFSESNALKTLPHFHFFGSFGNHDSYLFPLTKTSLIPPRASDVPDPLLRMLAIQLLSNCFTLNFLDPSLHSDPRTDLSRQNKSPQHVSALRILSQHRCSPAFGHNARGNSVVSPGPALCFEASGETKLGEEVTKRRTPRNQQETGMLSSQSGYGHLEILARASSSFELLPSQPETQHERLSSIDEVPLRKSLFRRSRLDRLFGPHAGNPHVTSRTTRLSFSDDGQPVTSLHPFLRSESHPVFIQPVKELVVRRSKLGRIRLRTRKIGIRERSDGPGPGCEARCITHWRRQLAMESASVAVEGGTDTPPNLAPVSPISESTISFLASAALASPNDFPLPVVGIDDTQPCEQLPDTTPPSCLESVSEVNSSVPVLPRCVRFETPRTNRLPNAEATSFMVNLSPLPIPNETPQDVASYQFNATPMSRRFRTSTAGTTVLTPHAIAETRANTELILRARLGQESTPSDDDWSTAPNSPVGRHFEQEKAGYKGKRRSFL